MKVTIRTHPEAFKRLRTMTEALNLDNGDRSGPLLRVLDKVARDAARSGINSRGGGAWAPLGPRYAAWKVKAGHGRRMMVLAKAYRGREARQLERKFTLAGEQGHIAKWNGDLRFSFGVSDDVGAIHETGGGHLPRRSVLDSIYAAREQFVEALVTFWRARIRQVLRHA